MKQYTDEFKRDAVTLVQAGAKQSQVCCDLGVSKSASSKWVVEAMHSAAGFTATASTMSAADQQAMRALARRNRLLEQEIEVLRRAAAYLSQVHITPPQ